MLTHIFIWCKRCLFWFQLVHLVRQCSHHLNCCALKIRLSTDRRTHSHSSISRIYALKMRSLPKILFCHAAKRRLMSFLCCVKNVAHWITYRIVSYMGAVRVCACLWTRVLIMSKCQLKWVRASNRTNEPWTLRRHWIEYFTLCQMLIPKRFRSGFSALSNVHTYTRRRNHLWRFTLIYFE